MATGLALADLLGGHPRVTACFFEEEAAVDGAFHESLNLAASLRLPVVYCCERNLYAMGTALDPSRSNTDLAAQAASYALPAITVDGMDVLAVASAAHTAIEAARSGLGPVFLELRTYRFRDHSMFDPELHRDRAEVEQWLRRDPRDAFGTTAARMGVTDEELAGIEAAIAAELAVAVEQARVTPLEPVGYLTRFVHSGRSTGA